MDKLYRVILLQPTCNKKYELCRTRKRIVKAHDIVANGSRRFNGNTGIMKRRMLFDKRTRCVRTHTHTCSSMQMIRVHVDVGFLFRSLRLCRNNRQLFSFQRDHPRVFSSIGVLLLQSEARRVGGGANGGEAVFLYERISMVIQTRQGEGNERETYSRSRKHFYLLNCQKMIYTLYAGIFNIIME